LKQNIEAILADLEAISKVNTEREFEKLMKKRELDPALPAPKA
jgi:carbamoylphosphate synthase large subunit